MKAKLAATRLTRRTKRLLAILMAVAMIAALMPLIDLQANAEECPDCKGEGSFPVFYCPEHPDYTSLVQGTCNEGACNGSIVSKNDNYNGCSNCERGGDSFSTVNLGIPEHDCVKGLVIDEVTITECSGCVEEIISNSGYFGPIGAACPGSQVSCRTPLVDSGESVPCTNCDGSGVIADAPPAACEDGCGDCDNSIFDRGFPAECIGCTDCSCCDDDECSCDADCIDCVGCFVEDDLGGIEFSPMNDAFVEFTPSAINADEKLSLSSAGIASDDFDKVTGFRLYVDDTNYGWFDGMISWQDSENGSYNNLDVFVGRKNDPSAEKNTTGTGSETVIYFTSTDPLFTRGADWAQFVIQTYYGTDTLTILGFELLDADGNVLGSSGTVPGSGGGDFCTGEHSWGKNNAWNLCENCPADRTCGTGNAKTSETHNYQPESTSPEHHQCIICYNGWINCVFDQAGGTACVCGRTLSTDCSGGHTWVKIGDYDSRTHKCSVCNTEENCSNFTVVDNGNNHQCGVCTIWASHRFNCATGLCSDCGQQGTAGHTIGYGSHIPNTTTHKCLNCSYTEACGPFTNQNNDMHSCNKCTNWQNHIIGCTSGICISTGCGYNSGSIPGHIYNTDHVCMTCNTSHPTHPPGTHNFVDGACTICKYPESGVNPCANGHDWGGNEGSHWCTRNQTNPLCEFYHGKYEAHNFVNGVCTICGRGYVDPCANGHLITYYNADGHNCGRNCGRLDFEPHNYVNFVCTGCGHRHPCAGGHQIAYYNADGHNCARNCGGLDFEPHNFVNGVCTGCGYAGGAGAANPCANGHLIRYYNADGHHCARNCGGLDFEPHNFVNDVCTACGYNRVTGDAPTEGIQEGTAPVDDAGTDDITTTDYREPGTMLTPAESIDNEHIMSILEKATAAGETPVFILADIMAETGGSVLTADMFLLIKELGIDVQVVLPSGFSYTIIADSISSNIGDFDLMIDIYMTDSDTSISDYDFPVGSIVIKPNFTGSFGFDIKIHITADQLATAGISAESVNLFHIDHENTVTFIGTLVANDDGSVDFTIDSASYYKLSAVFSFSGGPVADDSLNSLVIALGIALGVVISGGIMWIIVVIRRKSKAS